jgi:hypothetical protein
MFQKRRAMKKGIWEKPHLLVLVRTMPEDGVLQLQTCKFAELAGPGGIDCSIQNDLNGGQPGIIENCAALVIS